MCANYKGYLFEAKIFFLQTINIINHLKACNCLHHYSELNDRTMAGTP